MQVVKKMLRQFIVFAIGWYQEYVSPYKGYYCAHRVLHAGESCSQYAKRSFLEQDLVGAVKASQKRFRRCEKAAKILATQNDLEDKLLPLATNNLKGNFFGSKRVFVYLFISSLFTFGLATPALAANGRAYAKCCTQSTQIAVHEDTQQGSCCSRPEFYVLAGVLGIAAIFNSENKE